MAPRTGPRTMTGQISMDSSIPAAGDIEAEGPPHYAEGLSMPRRSPDANFGLIHDHQAPRQCVVADRIEEAPKRRLRVLDRGRPHPQSHHTPCEPTGYIRASAKSSSKVITIAPSRCAKRKIAPSVAPPSPASLTCRTSDCGLCFQ